MENRRNEATLNRPEATVLDAPLYLKFLNLFAHAKK
jgi:hypothetical protein